LVYKELNDALLSYPSPFTGCLESPFKGFFIILSCKVLRLKKSKKGRLETDKLQQNFIAIKIYKTEK
jgi:hypothetical protein